MVSTAFHTLSDVYAMAEDMGRTYDCYVNFLKYGNIYFKRICFENDFDFFISQVEDEYFFYHDVVNHAVTILNEHDFNASGLFLELCKYKNLVYIGEMWRRGHTNINDINRLLNRDFSFGDICGSIPQDTALIDFTYHRKWFTDEASAKKTDAYCIAFIIDSSGDVKRLNLGNAAELENMLNPGKHEYIEDDEYKWRPYDKSVGELTEKILCGIPDIQNLIICADGDFNSVSFASLPFKESYVMDYYAVKNIGSVYDIIYPRKRQPLKNALIFAAPDFGNPKSGEAEKWIKLEGSGLEGQLVRNTLMNGRLDDIRYHSGAGATLNAVKKAFDEKTYSIIHFSTHGCFDDTGVGIVTAGANTKDRGAIFWDSDLERYSLLDTGLIVYALCFGAMQTSKLNDSLSGLIKSSLLSGVNAIIAPLRPVEDFSSAVLLNEFYKLYITGERPEAALRRAVKRVRTMSGEELNAEYHIQTDGDYPYASPEHWSQWVCFSAEE
jgi:hypothetical protein